MTGIQITEDQITALLDKNYTLRYVDYRSNLDDNLDTIGKSIRTQDYQPLDELIDRWFEDDFYGLDSAIEELNTKLQAEFDITEEQAEAIIEEHRDHITQTIYDRDNSTPLDDALRNTGTTVAFYDTGLYLPECLNDRHAKESLKEIKKLLKIKLSDKTHDKNLNDMIINASYGGRLVIYFNPDKNDIKSLIQIGDNNTITFSNPTLAIIDTMNGSGGDTKLENFQFSLPINPENFFFDKEIKYNYTYEVCCMISTWCKSTNFQLTKRRTRKPPEQKPNSLTNQLEQERIYKETFQSGKCTHGDMDPYRHRNVIYQNTPPMCGSKCKDCGTFWID